MLTICLVADNHGHVDCLEKIKHDNPKCDYYFHLGDSMMPAEAISPFVSVKGNNDWDYDYEKKMIVELGGHKILLIHGNNYTYSYGALASKAQIEECDTVFFGHTHIYFDHTYGGIRMINPGSCYHNRDLSKPSYARVYILDDGTIKSERIDL